MPGGIIPADHEARTWHLDAGLVPFPAVPGITGMPRVCMSVPLSILRLITPDTSLRSRPVVILFVPGFRQQTDPVQEAPRPRGEEPTGKEKPGLAGETGKIDEADEAQGGTCSLVRDEELL